MPKRRRDDFGQEREQPGDRAISQQRAHLAHEIDYGKKTLHGALKIARGFERQKLGRRQKTAKDRQDAADGARLETEVLALKVCRQWLYVDSL